MADLTAALAVLAEGDPMRALPQAVLAAIVEDLGVTDTEQLLAIHDHRILAVAEASRRGDAKSLNRLRRWLAAQRHERGGRPTTPIETKARADEMVLMALHDIAEAVRAAVIEQRMPADEIARRCGTSREAVLALLAGDTPASFERVFRMAAVLGVRVQLSAKWAGSPTAGADPQAPEAVKRSRS
jgi:hypothetical protein